MDFKVIYRKLTRSEFVEDNIKRRLEHALERFHDENDIKAQVKIEMENSPTHAGADSYRCQVNVRSKVLRSIFISKRSTNLYSAIAEVFEKLGNVVSKVRNQRTQNKRRRLHLGILSLPPREI